DANGLTSTLGVSLTVAGQLTISTVRLPALAVARAYSAKLAVRGGVRPLRWRIAGGHLPRGIALNARTGALAGSATAAGTFRVRVSVTDFLGAVSSRPFVLAVRG